MRVGCAITAKKAGSLLRPALVEAAASRGITLVAIDLAVPLQEQGPFDVILHKVRREMSGAAGVGHGCRGSSPATFRGKRVGFCASDLPAICHGSWRAERLACGS